MLRIARVSRQVPPDVLLQDAHFLPLYNALTCVAGSNWCIGTPGAGDFTVAREYFLQTAWDPRTRVLSLELDYDPAAVVQEEEEDPRVP